MATPPMTPTWPSRAEEPGLDAAWEEACTAFKNAAGIDLKSAVQPSADDIRAKFDAKRSKDADDHRKIEKAKDIFTKTVIVVDRVGGIAAAGASMVFGSPATIAAGALNFFIEAGLQYKDIFTNIEDLLSQIVVVLERFQIYRDNQDTLDPHMKRVANKLLLAVVTICGICLKTLRANKVKTFFHMALFSNDHGVKAQLARLKALEAEESQMKGTLNLVAAETTKRNITTGFAQTKDGLGKISDGIGRMEAEMKDQKGLEDLKERLSIPKETNYVDEYRRYLDSLSGESCVWLHDDKTYQSWADAENHEHSLLVLAGEEGFGKSYTTTAILESLTRRYPQRQQTTNRTTVAYFYVTKGGRPGQVTSVHEILRILAWQISQNDLIYRKDIAAICKRVQHLGNTQDVCQRLFLDCFEEEATFFLAIDGIHELDSKEQNLLIETVKSLVTHPRSALKLKILLAARGPFVKNLSAKLPIAVEPLDLADRNKTDIERHIQTETKKLDIFQKQTQKVQELRDNVCQGLTEAVAGSFLYADYLLREINGKDRTDEVMAIVERAKHSGDLTDSITDVIKKCNQSLNAKELQDLNTLLLWVIYGEWTFDLSDLEAILYIQRGESSLKSLYNRITEQFSDFFTISPSDDVEYGSVSLKSDSIAQYLKEASDDQNPISATSQKALSKGEIKLVQNFIAKMCEPDIYDRLGLGSFFEQKLSESDTTISLDCENAHALITIDCLRAHLGDRGEEADILRSYAGYQLVAHLKQLDLDTVDPHYKAEIGPLLIRLLRDPEGMAQAWKSSNFCQCSFDDEISKGFVRLVRSSAVTKRLATGSDEKEWTTSVIDAPSPVIAIFEPMAKFVIKNWLEALDADENRTAFLWLVGHVNKIQHTEDPQKYERLEECPSYEEISMNAIEEIFEWAKTQDSVDVDFASTESLRNLGLTYRHCNHFDIAIDLLTKADSASKDNMRAACNLAKAYAFRAKESGRSDWETAIHHANRVIESTSGGKDVMEEGDAAMLLYTFRVLSAEWNQEIGHYDAAETIFNTILKEKPGDHEIRRRLLLMMCKQCRHDDVVATMQAMDQEKDGEQTRLLSFLQDLMDMDHVTPIISSFKQAGALANVKRHYQRAVEDAAKPKDEHTSATLYTYAILVANWASILHKHAEDHSEMDQAIHLWESLLSLTGPSSALVYPKYRASKYLSTVYLEKAIGAGRDSELATEMIGKVEALAIEDKDNYSRSNLSKDVVRSLLGRYFTAVGDQEQARAQLLPDVEIGIELLSDEDDDNDYLGFWKLAGALMDFGDDENALAACTMIVPNQGLDQLVRQRSREAVTNGDGDLHSAAEAKAPIAAAAAAAGDATSNGLTSPSGPSDDANETSMASDPDTTVHRPGLRHAHESQIEKKLAGPFRFTCDGTCERTWTFADDFYICRECIDIGFDDTCLEKLRAGTLGTGVCDPKHRMLYVPPFDPAAVDRVQRGMTLVGGKEIPFKDWREGIKEAWGIKTDKEEKANSANGDAGTEA